MTHTESSSSFPETQYVNGKLGEPLLVVLEGEKDVPPPGPGKMQMDSFDPAFLKVLSCGWEPQGEAANAATFGITFTPLQIGTTEVKFLIQPRAINPLFLPVTFKVTIEP